MDLLPIKEAAEALGFRNQEWYIQNLIDAGQVFGRSIVNEATGKEEWYVSRCALKDYLDRKKAKIEEDPTSVPGYSLENPAGMHDDPDAVYVKRPDFNNVSLLEAKTALTIVKAKREQYELERDLRPLVSTIPTETFEQFREELFEDLEVNRKDLLKAKYALQSPSKNTREKLLEYGVLERLQLVVAEMDRIRLLMKSTVSISNQQMSLFQTQLRILENQAQLFCKLLGKQMPDLKAVDKDYSEEDVANEEGITITVIDGEEKCLI